MTQICAIATSYVNEQATLVSEHGQAALESEARFSQTHDPADWADKTRHENQADKASSNLLLGMAFETIVCIPDHIANTASQGWNAAKDALFGETEK